MIGAITAVNKSKSGKALRITLNGKTYNAFLDSKLDEALGKVIEAQITPDKGYGEGIGQWAYSNAPAQPGPANAAPDPINRATVTPGASGDRFYLPFVSNTVAHCIAAGLIKNPSDVSPWAKAAYDAAQALDAL
jgi:hypothetical protein